METVTLTVTKRGKVGSRAAKRLRKEGFIPGILYGHGVVPVHLAIPHKTLADCLKHHVRVMKVAMEDGKEQAMVKEIQWDPFGGEILHVDLLRVRMDEVVSMNVRIETAGQARGVDEGGILEMQRTEIRVKCLPASIPDGITIDISGLGINESLHISDIALPEGVTCDDDPEQVVVSISAKAETVEVEEAAAEGEEGEAPSGETPEGEEKKDKEGDA